MARLKATQSSTIGSSSKEASLPQANGSSNVSILPHDKISPGSSPIPEQNKNMLDITNFKAQLSDLLKKHEDLQSDCSILRGEFYQHTRYGADICYIKWFKETPFDELTPFYKVDTEIRKMEKDLERMKDQLARGASYTSIDKEFTTIKLRLLELENNHAETIQSLRSLRIKCEAVAPNPQYDPPYYEYEADVHFEIIGNKPKPAGYTRPKAKALKHIHFRKAHDPVYLAQRTKEIEAEEENESSGYASRNSCFAKALSSTQRKRSFSEGDSSDENPIFVRGKRVRGKEDNGEGSSSVAGDKSFAHPSSKTKLTTSTNAAISLPNNTSSRPNDTHLDTTKGYRAESGGRRCSSRVKSITKAKIPTPADSIAKNNNTTKSKKGKEPMVLPLLGDEDQRTPPSLRISTSVKGKTPVNDFSHTPNVSPVLSSPLDLDNPLSFPLNMKKEHRKLAMAHEINKIIYSEREHEIKKKIFATEIKSVEHEKRQLEDDCKSLQKEVERLREEKQALEAEVKEVKRGLNKSLGLDV
ncbi:hypothetical protein BGZ60DRAFT_258055 [Tricladium varicosporioides]|nr:hypothetical protein BGZ60DRAFT_258055 [Hymenoscyphus varicosporioides]